MKKIADYKVIIVDLDGTLYYQQPVRLSMMTEMALRFWRIKDILIIKKYRKLYERGLTEDEKMKLLPDGADKIINEWMIQRSLKYVRKYRDKVIDPRATCVDRGFVKPVAFHTANTSVYLL